jgi:DNA-binding MarR family transcriptional regulator
VRTVDGGLLNLGRLVVLVYHVTLVRRVAHPTDRRTTLVQITDLGRSTVEDATVTLNEQLFADIGMAAGESQALVLSIDALRRNAGGF